MQQAQAVAELGGRAVAFDELVLVEALGAVQNKVHEHLGLHVACGSLLALFLLSGVEHLDDHVHVGLLLYGSCSFGRRGRRQKFARLPTVKMGVMFLVFRV